jgi:hypothetical protein
MGAQRPERAPVTSACSSRVLFHQSGNVNGERPLIGVLCFGGALGAVVLLWRLQRSSTPDQRTSISKHAGLSVCSLAIAVAALLLARFGELLAAVVGALIFGSFALLGFWRLLEGDFRVFGNEVILHPFPHCGSSTRDRPT